MPRFESTEYGDYVLHDRIGSGGMAEIFLATSRGIEGFEKRLVIKRILPTLSDDDQFVRMFIEEAKLCVALKHPNIVQVYDLGEIDHQYFIAMEYVDGRDLLKTLAACGRKRIGFPTDIALYIVMEVLRGLEHAHGLTRPDGRPLGIIHRDVSPSNILLSFEGEVKIGDFGIAKATTREKTVTGILKGKFGYMAPEQVTGAQIDHRADVFAAGIVLFELLTGHRLFAGKNDLAVLERVRDAVIDPPPRYYRPDLDDVLEAIVRKALARSVQDRFQTARDLHDALHEYVYRSRAQVSPAHLARFMQSLFLQDPEEQSRRARVRLPPVKPPPAHALVRPREPSTSLEEERTSISPLEDEEVTKVQPIEAHLGGAEQRRAGVLYNPVATDPAPKRASSRRASDGYSPADIVERARSPSSLQPEAASAATPPHLVEIEAEGVGMLDATLHDDGDDTMIGIGASDRAALIASLHDGAAEPRFSTPTMMSERPAGAPMEVPEAELGALPTLFDMQPKVLDPKSAGAPVPLEHGGDEAGFPDETIALQAQPEAMVAPVPEEEALASEQGGTPAPLDPAHDHDPGWMDAATPQPSPDRSPTTFGILVEEPTPKTNGDALDDEEPTAFGPGEETPELRERDRTASGFPDREEVAPPTAPLGSDPEDAVDDERTRLGSLAAAELFPRPAPASMGRIFPERSPPTAVVSEAQVVSSALVSDSDNASPSPSRPPELPEDDTPDWTQTMDGGGPADLGLAGEREGASDPNRTLDAREGPSGLLPLLSSDAWPLLPDAQPTAKEDAQSHPASATGPASNPTPQGPGQPITTPQRFPGGHAGTGTRETGEAASGRPFPRPVERHQPVREVNRSRHVESSAALPVATHGETNAPITRVESARRMNPGVLLVLFALLAAAGGGALYLTQWRPPSPDVIVSGEGAPSAPGHRAPESESTAKPLSEPAHRADAQGVRPPSNPRTTPDQTPVQAPSRALRPGRSRPPRVDQGEGAVQLSCPVPVDLYIRGRSPVAVTESPFVQPLSPGDYVVTVVREGRILDRKAVRIAAGTQVDLSCP